MDLDLTDRVVMVAGASRGLGLAIAQLAAAEGAVVSISARDAGALDAAAASLRTKGGRDVLTVAADLSTAEGAQRWIKDTAHRFGRIDQLCVNIGGPPPGSVLALADESWSCAFETLVLGAVRMARGVVPWMQFGGSVPTNSRVLRCSSFPPRHRTSRVLRCGSTAA